MVQTGSIKPILRELEKPLGKDKRSLGQEPVLEAPWVVGKEEPNKWRPLRMEAINLMEIVEACYLGRPRETLFLESWRWFTTEGISEKGYRHGEILPPT